LENKVEKVEDKEKINYESDLEILLYRQYDALTYWYWYFSHNCGKYGITAANAKKSIDFYEKEAKEVYDIIIKKVIKPKAPNADNQETKSLFIDWYSCWNDHIRKILEPYREESRKFIEMEKDFIKDGIDNGYTSIKPEQDWVNYRYNNSGHRASSRIKELALSRSTDTKSRNFGT